MIENMKVEFGITSDIDSWMRLVKKVSWNFPGLETEQSIDEHKIIVLKFMNDKSLSFTYRFALIDKPIFPIRTRSIRTLIIC